MDNSLRKYLEIPYDELTVLNLTAKQKMLDHVPAAEVEKFYRDYLKGEDRIKAVTLCFSDIEGRFHLLDYDKQFLLKSADNLTFDGSSIRGFTELAESDLRLQVDWSSFRWLPADVFGPGKVLMFGMATGKEGVPYPSDIRGQLKLYLEALYAKDKTRMYMATELEGFLLEGVNVEQLFDEKLGFQVASKGGYYHALPQDELRVFIDRVAEAQRAMAFENEKDHPEVAPAQFELNYSYTDALIAADNIQLYKLVARQIAQTMGMTASFLPKPVVGINGSGMHTNISLYKGDQNLFYSKKDELSLSPMAYDFTSRILNHAPELCLLINGSVNAYRRLDPNFEAPNQIKMSPVDRGSMIRIPIGNEKSTRIEVRSVGPDSNPYLVAYSLLKTGLEGDKLVEDPDKRQRVRTLPGNILDAIRLYKSSDFITKILGEDVKNKYVAFKQLVANRCPADLGKTIKNGEVLYNHEVTNQVLWNSF